MPFTAGTLKAAHKHSVHHEDEIKRSIECGCFYCLSRFQSSEILYWAEERLPTAICPRCGIDSVIGDASGFPIHDPGFLKAMHEYWFESPQD